MRRLCAFTLLLAMAGCAAQSAPPDLTGRRFIVFFQTWSAGFDQTALGSIQAAADEIKAQPTEKLVIIGYADPTGSVAANILLSQLRAQVVADQLALDGVSPTAVLIQGKGETGYKLSSQESRRVEIVATR